MTGSLWAHFAWGSYWRRDPKETWSLITWLVYALMLHARVHPRPARPQDAMISFQGFVCVIFTSLRVNYLDSLHSYF